jgi:hypothetical protein
MTMGPVQKTFLVLRPFEGALTCSILIAGTQVMLRKAYFLRRESWLRPESWTPRPRIQSSGPYYETQAPTDLCSKFQLSRCYTGREIGHRRTDGRTDARHNDFRRVHFLKMCSNKSKTQYNLFQAIKTVPWQNLEHLSVCHAFPFNHKTFGSRCHLGQLDVLSILEFMFL